MNASRPEITEERLGELFAEVPVPSGVRQWQTITVPKPRPRLRPWRWSVAAGAAAFAVAGILILINGLPVGGPPTPPSQTATVPVGGPTPTPGATLPADPSWPNASNTGVPPGTALTTHEGDLRVSEPGAVIEDLYVHGVLYIEAPDVTVRRVKVEAPSGAGLIVRQSDNAPGLTIEDCELIAESPTAGYGVVQLADRLAMTRCHVSQVAIGVAAGRHAVVADNLINHLAPSMYTTGIVTYGNTAGPIELRHNTVDMGGVEVSLLVGIGLLTTYGASRDIVVENNLIAGGFFCLNAGGSQPGTHGVRIIGNHFSRALHQRCGSVGPATDWDGTQPDAVWSGNVWHESGEEIPAP